MDLLMLDFFEALRPFYGWGFPWKVMMSVIFLIGLAVGVFPKPGSRVRKIGLIVFGCVLALAELDWQLIREESHMLFYICGWFAEAALLGAVVGWLVYLVWMKVRR